ncbi:FHA domain-containing protein [Cupriavidus alkaliphilus]|uniref:FHA domain-containing protein n=1 Tax=Cupriavidus alkaliphilus TaxID=942866 RepID=UPI000815C175|nr:FHA domain-containing protein [Cupriavidus alkaliphilus]SCB31060.1 type III secretion protein D [Cupriavidus alkaliphilus]
MADLRDSQASGWTLRFLGGDVYGRQVTLRRGANVLGTAADVDISVPGAEVQPRHLVLNVGELAVSAERVGEAAVTVNGRATTQRAFALAGGDILTIGALDVELLRAQPGMSEATDTLFAWAESGRRAARDADAQQQGGRRPGRALLATLGVAGVVGLVGAGWLAATYANGGLAPRTQQADPAAVRKTVAAYPELEVVSLPNGTVTVKGFVNSRVDRQRIVQALAPFGRGVQQQVRSADDLIEHIQRYLDEPGVGIAYQGQGRVLLSGTADPVHGRDKVRRVIEDLHPGVLVSDKIDYRETAESRRRQVRDGHMENWQGVFPARVVSITEDGNGTRSVQLANGARYFEGAVLKNGAEIERIDADGVVLKDSPVPPQARR